MATAIPSSIGKREESSAGSLEAQYELVSQISWNPRPKKKKKKANKAYAGEEEKQGEVGITHGTLTGPENSSS